VSVLPPAPVPGPSSRSPLVPDGVPRPSTAGYWVAGVVFLAGAIGAIVWLAVSVVGALTLPDDFDRVPVPGEMTVELDEGEHTLWEEERGTTGTARPTPRVEVLAPDGTPVRQRGPSATQTYTVGEHRGTAFAEFVAETDGSYTVRAFGEPDGRQVAVGTLFDLGAVWGILGAIVVGVVSFLVALIVFVVTLVRRSRAARPPFSGPPRGGSPAHGFGPGRGAAPGWGPPSSPTWGPSGPASPGWGPPPGSPPPRTPPGWDPAPSPPPAPPPSAWPSAPAPPTD
jgi:hypothetical protein